MATFGRKLKKQKQPPGVTDERLEAVHVYYRNARGSMFDLVLDESVGCSVRGLQATLRNILETYPDDEDFRRELFEQLDGIAEVFDPYWIKKAKHPSDASTEDIRRELESLFEPGVHWAYVATCNVYWLEQKGHLKTDNFNGVVFRFSWRNPSGDGPRVRVQRNTLDPQPGTLGTLSGQMDANKAKS